MKTRVEREEREKRKTETEGREGERRIGGRKKKRNEGRNDMCMVECLCHCVLQARCCA